MKVLMILILILAFSCKRTRTDDKLSFYYPGDYCTQAIQDISIPINKDTLRQIYCNLLRLYNEPCFPPSENENNMIRMIVSTPRDYTIIYRISRTHLCDIATIKIIPPNMFSDFYFYYANRIVSYKLYEFPIQKIVFDNIENEISNLKPIEQPSVVEGEKFREYTLEYYLRNRYMINDTSSVWKGMDMRPIEKILMEYMPKDDGEALYGRLRRRPGEF